MTTKALANPARAAGSRRQAAGNVETVPATEQERCQKPTSIYSFIDVFRADPLTRVRMIKEGLPPDYMDQLSRRLNIPKERLLPALGISPATVSRRVREAKPLSSDDSERVLGMVRLVGQVQDTAEGQAIVSNLLPRMQSGAYA